jgi:hypothetical protein
MFSSFLLLLPWVLSVRGDAVLVFLSLSSFALSGLSAAPLASLLV